MKGAYTGGNAVYSARVMLNIDVEDGESNADKNYSNNNKPKNTASKAIEVKLYPNPAKEQLTVEFSGNSDIQESYLEVFSLLGSRTAIYPLNSNKEKIATDNLEAGIYYYKISVSGKNCDTGKLIIIK